MTRRDPSLVLVTLEREVLPRSHPESRMPASQPALLFQPLADREPLWPLRGRTSSTRIHPRSSAFILFPLEIEPALLLHYVHMYPIGVHHERSLAGNSKETCWKPTPDPFVMARLLGKIPRSRVGLVRLRD
jgi:hypothetical protein